MQNKQNKNIIIKTDNLYKSYGKKPIIKGVSFSIQRNKVTALLGPNGAGKTTIFYMLVGLEKVSSGHIYLNDTQIETFPIYKRAQLGINYLPQDTSIFRKLTVENNIKAILELKYQNNAKELNYKLEEILDFLSIKHIRHSMGYMLSGGERRRVEIARALASNPSVLLLDEPFTGIDPLTIQDIQKTIAHLVENLDLTIIITDHNVRETLKIIDYAYLIMDGKVFYEGTPSEFAQEERVRSVYLGDDFLF